MKFIIFILLGGFATLVENANILFFFGLSTYSHRIVIWPLIKKLSESGHNVTFFSGYPPKEPIANVVEFSPENLYSKFSLNTDFFSIRLEHGVKEIDRLWFDFPSLGLGLCENMLEDQEVLTWANSSSYDLVFVDGVFNDCGLALVHKFKAKHIMFGTSSPFTWWADTYGYLSESATYPEHTLHLPQKMTFYQRIRNTFRMLYWHWINNYYYYPALGKIMRESSLNIPDMPNLAHLHRDSNLVFTNTHFSEEYPRMLPPMVIPIGGMHCSDDRKSLPTDIREFIESAGDNDVVYISFGSFVQYSKMPQKYMDIFIDTFAKLAQTRFLWKFDGERPKNLPNNTLTKSWMPQQDILAHPKIKAFLSHGGLLGTQEAVFHGVPMIVFPIFAEQDYNAERIHARGNGIRLEISTLTQTELETTLMSVLTDKSYRRTMQEMSKLFKDRPSKAVDTAVWWTEYVLRHKDTKHLQPLSALQTWYQRRLLDVWIFLFTMSLVAFLSLYMLTSKLLKALRSKKEKHD